MLQTHKNEQTYPSETEEMRAQLHSLSPIQLAELKPEKSILIAIDMVNGFAKKGALYSPYVEALLPGLSRLAGACSNLGIACLAFLDEHPEDSPEFSTYPMHCLKGSWESRLSEELEEAAPFKTFYKHSTNGVLAPLFQTYLIESASLDTVIVAGCCTDICVLQFALSIKAWFHEQNRAVRVIVPRNLVDTFEAKGHNRSWMNHISFYLMLKNGIEVVQRIEHGEDA